MIEIGLVIAEMKRDQGFTMKQLKTSNSGIDLKASLPSNFIVVPLFLFLFSPC